MAIERRNIETIIFDLDDTLISWANPSQDRKEFTWPRVAKIHSYLLESDLEVPPLEEFWFIIDEASISAWAKAKKNWQIESFGDILARVFTELGLPVDQIDIDEVLRQFDWGPRPGVVIFPDTHKVLKELQRRGYKLGLLTNSYLPMWMRDVELDSYDLLDYWDARITAADVGYLKPHKEIFLTLLGNLETEACKTVFVGDRPKNDIVGANEVGMVSVMMKPDYLHHELDGVKPDYTIHCLDELLPILEKLG
jgi:HAD superfamily hydrolase (TIGR01509 family)